MRPSLIYPVFLAALWTASSALIPPPLSAECRYFRIGYKASQCKEVKPADIKALQDYQTDVPELPATDQGQLLRVRCGCDYTLSGSDPLCDPDISQEFSSLMGADARPGENPCHAAKGFCEQICPTTLRR